MIKLTSKVYSIFESSALEYYKSNRIEEAILFSEVCTRIAFSLPFGKNNHDTIENILFNISKKLSLSNNSNKMNNQSNKSVSVLHILPKLIDGGGSKLYSNKLIENAKNGLTQVVLNTQSSSTKLDNNYIDYLTEMNVVVRMINIDNNSQDKIKSIYNEISYYKPSSIFNYSTVSATDYIALLMIKRNTNIPIYWFNLGDMFPILGKQLSDNWIEYRKVGISFSKHYRRIKKMLYAPLPIPTRNSKLIQPKAFGIPDSSSISITVSSFYKLLNHSKPNYFDYVFSLLSLVKTHYHILICPGFDSEIITNVNKELSRRLIILDYRDDLDSIFKICDFGIEGYPIKGGIVRKEFIFYKIPFISIRTNDLDILDLSDHIDNDYPLFVKSIEEFTSKSISLISSKGLHNSWNEYINDKIKIDKIFKKNATNIHNNNFIEINDNNLINKIKSHDINQLHSYYTFMKSYSYNIPLHLLMNHDLKLFSTTIFKAIICILLLFTYRVKYLKTYYLFSFRRIIKEARTVLYKLRYINAII